MGMFCYQCQETMKNTGCVSAGICGKSANVANLQDVLIYALKGVAYWADKAAKAGKADETVDIFVTDGLFATITNVNFDEDRFVEWIHEAMTMRDKAKALAGGGAAPAFAEWNAPADKASLLAFAPKVSVLAETNEDIRSLKELIMYGLKGVAAYASHAAVLGFKKPEIFAYFHKALANVARADISVDELLGLTIECGQISAATMALLDEANTTTFGKQTITQVSTGVVEGPGILVSGHDLLDIYELLEQTKGTGVNVYTHGEMLVSHAYPGLKKYPNLVANFGTSWYNQQKEFEEFGGAILFTTNCIQKPRDSYKDNVFTTGTAGWPGWQHVADRKPGAQKDFSAVIAKAKALGGLKPREGKTLTIGFAKDTVMSVADKVVDAVKAGAIKRFVVMAGCDGHQKERQYFTDVAEALPKDAVILTAGCAKFRYNMLDLGDIGGIPRVLDAGQCNDSYSLAYIALQLQKVFGAADINDLPISFDVAWYEQKAVAVLLALLALGFKGVRLGPTLPAFLSPTVAGVLVEKFGIMGTTTVEADVHAIMTAK